jgi:hypothetical protein
MSNATPHASRGFTLIEALLYIAIGSVMCAFLGAIASNLLVARTKTHLIAEAHYVAEFAFERMSYASEGASVDVPAVGASVPRVAFMGEDGTRTEFFLEDGALMMQEGADGEPQALSGERLRFDLQATRITSARGGVRVTLIATPAHEDGVPIIEPQVFTTSLLTMLP